MRPGPSAQPELDDGFPVQLEIFFSEKVYDSNQEPSFGPENNSIQRFVEVPTSRLAFEQRSFGRYQFYIASEDTVLAQLSTPIDQRLF